MPQLLVIAIMTQRLKVLVRVACVAMERVVIIPRHYDEAP